MLKCTVAARTVCPVRLTLVTPATEQPVEPVGNPPEGGPFSKRSCVKLGPGVGTNRTADWLRTFSAFHCESAATILPSCAGPIAGSSTKKTTESFGQLALPVVGRAAAEGQVWARAEETGPSI